MVGSIGGLEIEATTLLVHVRSHVCPLTVSFDPPSHWVGRGHTTLCVSSGRSSLLISFVTNGSKWFYSLPVCSWLVSTFSMFQKLYAWDSPQIKQRQLNMNLKLPRFSKQLTKNTEDISTNAILKTHVMWTYKVTKLHFTIVQLNIYPFWCI